ncbi:MAG: RagB/SusD family nutrient uptake outer membrane protein [Bacteroidota bacterium]
MRIKNLVTILALLILIPSCESFLEEDVYSFISKNNFYLDKADAEAALIGAYTGRLSQGVYGRWFYDITHLIDDQVTIHRNPEFITMDEFDFTADHPYVGALWTDHFRAVERANVVIGRISQMENIDESFKTMVVAEARFLRANMYFNLVRLFGRVPLSLEETGDEESAHVPMSSVEAVYNAIEEDLKYAEENLPNSRPSSEFGRATKGAAKAMLADVYMNLEKWAEAAQRTKEIIDMNQYTLLENFEDIFKLENETNSEIIHSIVYDGNTNGNWFASFAHASGNINANNGVQVWQVDTESDMWLNWDDNDYRKDFTVYTDYITKDGTQQSVYNTSRPYPAFGKYNAPNETGLSSCPINQIIYRYADILLMYAEASCEVNGGPTNESYEALNMVRRRGYKQPINEPSDYDVETGLNKDSFKDAVIYERSLEFVVEGKRALDLMRTGKLIETLVGLGKKVRPGATLLPIPKGEIDANPKLSDQDQNQGY